MEVAVGPEGLAGDQTVADLAVLVADQMAAVIPVGLVDDQVVAVLRVRLPRKVLPSVSL